MLKATRRNFILAGLLGSLVALLAWLPEDRPTPPAHRLMDELPSDIRVFRRDNEQWTLRYRLYRDGGAWWISDGTSEPRRADPVRAESASSALLAPSRRSWSPGEIPATQSGLGEPGYRILADDREIMVGSRGALGNQRYVSDGTRVLLVSDVISYQLQRPVDSFLPKPRKPEDSTPEN